MSVGSNRQGLTHVPAARVFGSLTLSVQARSTILVDLMLISKTEASAWSSFVRGSPAGATGDRFLDDMESYAPE